MIGICWSRLMGTRPPTAGSWPATVTDPGPRAGVGLEEPTPSSPRTTATTATRTAAHARRVGNSGIATGARRKGMRSPSSSPVAAAPPVWSSTTGRTTEPSDLTVPGRPSRTVPLRAGENRPGLA